MPEMMFGALVIVAVILTVAAYGLKEAKMQLAMLSGLFWIIFGVYNYTLGDAINIALGTGGVFIGIFMGLQGWAFRDKQEEEEEKEETLDEASERHDRERIANRGMTAQMRAEAAERKALRG